MAQPLYESIGRSYSDVRRPDPHIERQILDALGDAGRIVNVGAGAGSYEPTDRFVVAVEPSPTMIAQRPRPTSGRPVVRGVADELPFADASFDGALASLTIHHWPDPLAGLREMRRVANGPVVVFTFDYAMHARQWLVAEYLPLMRDFDRHLPSPEAVAAALGGGRVEVVPVPADCEDGFCHAWWKRPGAYLDATVQAGISGIARLPADYVAAAMRRLAADLADGTWARRHADLLERDAIDGGYRLVVSPSP